MLISPFVYLKQVVRASAGSLQAWIDDYGPESFTHFCNRHQLTGILYPYLSSEHLVAAYQNVFKAHYLAQWETTLHLLRALHRCLDVLQTAGVSVIVLKGAYFASRFYGDVHGRPYNDLDLLVPRHQFEQARRVLLADGYTPSRSSSDSARYFESIHHLELTQDSINIDLHHTLRASRYIDLDMEAIWQSAHYFSVDHAQLRVLPDEYSLLVQLLTLHNDFAIGTLHGRVMLDGLLIIQTLYPTLDWDMFFEHRKADRTFTLCLNMFSLILHCFDCFEDFPTLAAYIHDHEEAIISFSEWEPLLFEPVSRGFMRRKWLAFSLYETPTLQAMGWWLMNLPLRYVFYKQNILNRAGR